VSIISLETRITHDEGEFETLKRSDQSRIYCTAETTHPFEIVLRLGDQWAQNVSRDDPKMYLVEDQQITIAPQQSVVVEVADTIMMPFNIYGLIVQKGTAFLEDGLILAAGKVDPSFSGKLQVLIFNSTRKPKKINQGDELGNLVFMRTERTLDRQLFPDEQAAKVKSRTWFGRTMKFFSADPRFTLNWIAMIVSSSLTAAVVTWYLAGPPNVATRDLPDVAEKTQSTGEKP